MVNRGCWGSSDYRVRGGILRLRYDARMRKHLPKMFSLIKNESMGIEDA